MQQLTVQSIKNFFNILCQRKSLKKKKYSYTNIKEMHIYMQPNTNETEYYNTADHKPILKGNSLFSSIHTDQETSINC